MDQLNVLSLPLLPLTTGVVLPGMVVTIPVDGEEVGAAVAAATDADGRLILVPKSASGAYARVGTIAAVEDAGELPSGTRAIVVRGLHRGKVGAAVLGDGAALRVSVEPAGDAP